MTRTIPALRSFALTAAGAAALAFGATHGAAAQSYDHQGYYDRGYDDQGYNDQYPADEAGAETLGGVTVVAPRHYERDAATGAPIETVFVNRVVRTDDLDLNYWRDRHILHHRVVRAAQDACTELDQRFPVTASDSPPCVRDAVRRTMARLEDAGYGY